MLVGVLADTHDNLVNLRKVVESQPLVLNPGEAGGWLTGKPTCAILDLAALRAELLSL